MDSDPGASAPQHDILSRSPRLLLAALVLFYLAITCAQAATKLLWTDELITLAIARTGSLRGIWHALALGADPNPPLSHVLVLLSIRVFGTSALAIRLPAILCILLALLCLWTILRRWLPPAYAALGVLSFMATRGFDYAYNARSYAPLTAFSLAALACWLRTTPRSSSETSSSRFRTRLQWPWALLMALSLAAAVSSNYFGVLAWFPIALGEFVLTLHTRRPRPVIWIALAIAALPLLAFRPLIHHNLAEFAPHAWNRPHLDLLTNSYLLLVEGVLWPTLAAAVAFAFQRRPHNSSATNLDPAAPIRKPTAASRLLPHEAAAVLTLLAYPFLGLALAYAGHGMISPRCVLPVCAGVALALAVLTHRLFANRPGVTAALLIVAFLWVTARESACAYILHQQRTAFLALRDRIAATPGTGPILLSDSLFALPLAHYAPASLRPRLVYPIDFAAIDATEPDDSGERNLWAGRNGLWALRITPSALANSTAAPISAQIPAPTSTQVASPTANPALLPAPVPALVIARPDGWLPQQLAARHIPLTDITTPAESSRLAHLGGVFTPLAHPTTRLLAPTRPAATTDR